MPFGGQGAHTHHSLSNSTEFRQRGKDPESINSGKQSKAERPGLHSPWEKAIA